MQFFQLGLRWLYCRHVTAGGAAVGGGAASLFLELCQTLRQIRPMTFYK